MTNLEIYETIERVISNVVDNAQKTIVDSLCDALDALWLLLPEEERETLNARTPDELREKGIL